MLNSVNMGTGAAASLRLVWAVQIVISSALMGLVAARLSDLDGRSVGRSGPESTLKRHRQPRTDQGSFGATQGSVLVRLFKKATILPISASLRLRGCSTGLRLGSGLPPLAM